MQGWLILCMTLVKTASTYRHFQDEVPNGDAVFHPCKANFIWRGVGHRNVLGSGVLNVFGEAFKKAGKRWTTELCKQDSDGDGLTNGQELGDPDCIWQPGKSPIRVTEITHPGVCDPWESAKCKMKNIWVSCDVGEFKCDAINQPDVRNFTLRFPLTKVPPTETNYMCMTFDLPHDDDYHMIATIPLINNSNVMHHIVLYGCQDYVETSTQPSTCYMSRSGCGEVIGIWTLGMTGECLYKDAGFHIGKTGIKKAALQFHWTNPLLRHDYVDSSGLTLFYTPKRRKYDAGTLVTGQKWLEIPPGKARTTQVSTCTSETTKAILNGPIHVTSALNHMHYLGFEQNVELFRGERKVTDLAYDPVYSYDTPIIHRYSEPVVIMPGDSLKTTCVFRSLSRKQTTYYGEGSYNEMCYGVFTVYPRQNLTDTCITWKNVFLGDFDYKYKHCPKMDFMNSSIPATKQIYRKVLDNCNFYGSCRAECPGVLEEVRKHPCLQGELHDYMLNLLSKSHDMEELKFVMAMRSCDCPTESPTSESPVPNTGTNIVISIWTALGFATIVFLAK